MTQHLLWKAHKERSGVLHAEGTDYLLFSPLAEDSAWQLCRKTSLEILHEGTLAECIAQAEKPHVQKSHEIEADRVVRIAKTKPGTFRPCPNERLRKRVIEITANRWVVFGSNLEIKRALNGDYLVIENAHEPRNICVLARRGTFQEATLSAFRCMMGEKAQ